MCSNYRPVTSVDRLLTFFGAERDHGGQDDDVFPNGLAPMLRLDPDAGTPRRRIEQATFRFVPESVSKLEWARKTYNIRSETVATKSTFAKAWAGGQRCIIPVEHYYEPRYFGTLEDPGKSQRWAIAQPGRVPMGVAGVYKRYVNEVTGEVTFGMGMLTVNADGHPVMDLFFKPGDEKRIVVILDPADYDTWLTCAVEEAPRFFTRWTGELDIFHAPTAPRVKKASQPTLPRALPKGPTTGDLF